MYAIARYLDPRVLLALRINSSSRRPLRRDRFRA